MRRAERRDAEFEQKMAEVLRVYREVEILKNASANGRRLRKPMTIVSCDEKPGIQANATTVPDLPPKPSVYTSFARDHEYKCHGTLSLQAHVVEHGVRQQLLQPRVLVLQRLPPLCLQHIQPAKIGLPFVDADVADAMRTDRRPNCRPHAPSKSR